MGKGRDGTVPRFFVPVPLVPRDNLAGQSRENLSRQIPGQPPIPVHKWKLKKLSIFGNSELWLYAEKADSVKHEKMTPWGSIELWSNLDGEFGFRAHAESSEWLGGRSFS